MSAPRYEVREAKSDDGIVVGFYYVEIGGNGEVQNTSETYTRREDAERGIESAIRNAALAGESRPEDIVE